MHQRVKIPLLALLVILSACEKTGMTNPSPTPTSGIEGTVTEGPMCPGPVQVGNNLCPDKPYQASILIYNNENIEVAQIQSDVNGIFKIGLPPGTYTLHPISGKPFPVASDQTVVVNPGQYTQVAIMFDTGIR